MATLTAGRVPKGNMPFGSLGGPVSGRDERVLVGRACAVEPVRPGVPQQVARPHRDHHGERGKDNRVRGVEEVEAGIVEHGAPTGNGRENAEAEETEGGFGGDCSGQADGGLDQHGRVLLRLLGISW